MQFIIWFSQYAYEVVTTQIYSVTSVTESKLALHNKPMNLSDEVLSPGRDFIQKSSSLAD